MDYLGLHALPAGRQDAELLAHGTIAPVGNLRIKEAVPDAAAKKTLEERRFPMQSVVERQGDFLEYAQQMGSASGGATGAGGEAPKLLLRLTEDEQVWIDTWQDDPHQPDLPMLVKFPRGSRSSDDCDILRAEYHYYQELTSLGVETINTAQMRLVEGERYPYGYLTVPHETAAACVAIERRRVGKALAAHRGLLIRIRNIFQRWWVRSRRSFD